MRKLADERLKLLAGYPVRHPPQVFDLGKLAAHCEEPSGGLHHPPPHALDAQIALHGSGHGIDHLAAGDGMPGKTECLEGPERRPTIARMPRSAASRMRSSIASRMRPLPEVGCVGVFSSSTSGIPAPKL